jgi:hypothetical protein
MSFPQIGLTNKDIVAPSTISRLAENLYQNITFLLSTLLSLPFAVFNCGPNIEGMKIFHHLLLERKGNARDLWYSKAKFTL